MKNAGFVVTFLIRISRGILSATDKEQQFLLLGAQLRID
jgi:hypothetical protein